MDDLYAALFLAKVRIFKKDGKFVGVPAESLSSFVAMAEEVAFNSETGTYSYRALKVCPSFCKGGQNWQRALRDLETLKQHGLIDFKMTGYGALVDFTPFWELEDAEEEGIDDIFDRMPDELVGTPIKLS